MKRRLHPSALYHSGSYMENHIRRAEEAQALGLPGPDGDCRDYLGAWDRAAENIRRTDPEGVMAFILMKLIDYKPNSIPYRALSRLSDAYRQVPEESRKAPVLNRDFRCRISQIIAQNPKPQSLKT
jgi:hypothetical protein